jgi:hypothetical protein
MERFMLVVEHDALADDVEWSIIDRESQDSCVQSFRRSAGYTYQSARTFCDGLNRAVEWLGFAVMA